MKREHGSIYLDIPGITRRENKPNQVFCPFCDGVHPSREVRFYHDYPELVGLPQQVIETRSFVATVDMAPITDYHVVFFPKTHITSFAQIGQHEELYGLLKRLKIAGGHSDYVEFEHGMGINELGTEVALGKSVYHAHYHVVGIPSNVNCSLDMILQSLSIDYANLKLLTVSDADTFRMIKIKSFGMPYLWLRVGEQGVVFVDDQASDSSIPSQFFRQGIAKLVYGEDCLWDWKNTTIDQKAVFQARIKKILSRFQTEN